MYKVILLLALLTSASGDVGQNDNVWLLGKDYDLYSDGVNKSKRKATELYVRKDSQLGFQLDCNDNNANVYPGENALVLSFDNDCSSDERNIFLLNKIVPQFNSLGYFSKANEREDISYQEVVSFLTQLNIHYDDVYSLQNIKDSIRWSFDNLRETAGGFKQNGTVRATVRTSLYLFSVANSCMLDVRLTPICDEYAGEILESASWVSNFPTPWPGNHDLAALLMFQRLFQLTSNAEYYQMYSLKRGELIQGFVHKTVDTGYWPEAPATWKNRLLTPYMQTQIIFAGYYLVLNPQDSEFKELFIKEANLFSNYADMASLTIDVSDSYDYIDSESDIRYRLGHPSVVYHLCLQADLYCEFVNDSVHAALYYDSMLTVFRRDDGITLFSDSFLRYGVIPELSVLLLHSGRSYQ